MQGPPVCQTYRPRNVRYPQQLTASMPSIRRSLKHHGLCRWEMAIFDPHRIHTPWPITKKFVASDQVGDPYGGAKFGANPSTGGFWKNAWNITKILFIYLFIYTLFSWTHLQVRPADGFSRLMAQTTRIRARMCLLGVSLTLLPILGVKYPQTPNFGGVNRRFQAKRLSLIHIWRCRRSTLCRSRWSPYH